jgi:hypothetical protein
VDQNGLSANPAATDLTARAKGQWYHREIAIPSSGVAKRLDGVGHGVFLAFEAESPGDYKTFIRNAKITNGGVTMLSIYEGDRDYLFPSDTGYTTAVGYSINRAAVALANAILAEVDYTPYYSGFQAPGSDAALYLRAVNTGSGNCYYLREIARPAYALAAGDVLQYDLYLSDDAPAFTCGLDLMADSWRLGGSGAVDQNGVSAYTKVDLAARAKGQWYHREIAIPSSGVGKSLSAAGGVCWVFEGDAQGTYGVYLKGIKITNGGVTKLTIWDGDTAYGWPGYNWSSGYAATAYGVALPLDAMPENTLEYADFEGQNVAQALADLALEANAVLCEQPDRLQFLGRDRWSSAEPHDIDGLIIGSPSDQNIWDDYYNVVVVKGTKDRKARYGQLAYPSRTREVTVRHVGPHDWLQAIAMRLYGWFARTPRVLRCEIWGDDWNYQVGKAVHARGADWDITNVSESPGTDTISLVAIQRNVAAPVPGSTRLDGEVVVTDPPFEPVGFVLTTNYSAEFREIYPADLFPATRTDYYWNGTTWVYVTSTLYEMRWQWPYDDMQDLLYGFIVTLYASDRDNPIMNVPSNVRRQSDGYFYSSAYVWQASSFMGDCQAIFKNGLVSIPSEANSSSPADDGNYYGVRTPEEPANEPNPLVQFAGCFTDAASLPSAADLPEGTLSLVKINGQPGRLYIIGHDDNGAKVWQRFDAVT